MPCNDLAWVWLCLMRYSILPARLAYVCNQWLFANKEHLRVNGAYANKIFSFSSISWHFLVEFMCQGVRKAFQYVLKTDKSSWHSLPKDLAVNCSFPQSPVVIMLDPVQLMSRFPHSFSKSFWNPTIMQKTNEQDLSISLSLSLSFSLSLSRRSFLPHN